jgi:hypothetical protein
MATLRNEGSGAELTLRGRVVVGRSPRADVRLTGLASSNEHASIHWSGREWLLRDLTSRNGTTINGRRLVGEEWRLVEGDRIVFGDPGEVWRWLDGAAPRPSAVEGGAEIAAVSGELLLLPDAESPRASIYPGEDQWEMDLDGAQREVADGDTVTIDGRQFRLVLPSLHPSSSLTRAVVDDQSLATCQAIFAVSRDQETVDLTLRTRGEVKRLPRRSFHFMLLLLAQARTDDAATGVPPEEAGWTYIDDLAKKLGNSIENINVDVHRARGLLARTKFFVDPTMIVERRRNTGQLRFGVQNIVVEGAAKDGPER